MLNILANRVHGGPSLPDAYRTVAVRNGSWFRTLLSFSGPGYLVSVGYYVAGLPGAFAGLIALITPAFLIIPMMSWIGKYANIPRIRGAIRAVILASAGLLIAASIPLARDAATGPLAIAIIITSFVVLAFTRVESWWVMLAAAAVGLAAKLLS